MAMEPVPLVDLPAAWQAQRDSLETALVSVASSGALVLGTHVSEFEAAFAAYCGTQRSVGVASGTAAVHLGLRAVGVRPGDEVITVPHTFHASAEAIHHAGATPVFVDVDERTGGMDPKALTGVVDRAAAIVPVHLYGQPVDMQPILESATAARVPVVEDAAQAHGAEVRAGDGRPPQRVGAMGAVGAFSFYPAKNLGALGDAGAVTTDDEAVADRVSRLRDHGRTSKYEHAEPGFGERLDALQAAVLTVRLARLEAANEARRRLAERYSAALRGVGDLVLPTWLPERPSVWHLYVVRSGHRTQLLDHLHERGIQAGMHYPQPLHLQPAWRHLGHARGDFPVAEAWAAECLSLPLYPEMTCAQQDRVVEAVVSYFTPVEG
jgi:dTDP-4-amino-4,6-dideoxygalactose transaminase